MRRSQSLLWLWALAAVAVVVLFMFLPAKGALRMGIASAGSWLIKPVSAVARLPGGIIERINIFRDAVEHASREEGIVIDRAAFELIKQENDALRRALNMVESAKRKSVYSEVIGGFSEGRDEYLIVKLPDGASLHEGAVAFSPQGVLLGFVRAATESTATIRLASSPDETVTVTIVGAGVDAVMKGNNNGEYIVSLVPESALVETGAVVVTSGRNPGVPGGTPVGVVVSLEKIPGELYYQVRVKSPVSFATLSNAILFLD